MENQVKAAGYQQALALAEAGQHEQALRLIRSYLQANPNDAEALNDAGTILFCMNRGAEAIELLEKARIHANGDLLSQILWNLCEAYLQEDRPAEAALLFDDMANNKVLNIEILNRTANSFLQREALGGAMECLLRSLSEASEQEVLHPIVEVIRSKRPVATLVADELTPAVQAVYDWLNPRFRTELILSGQRQLPTVGGLTLAVGVGQVLRQLSLQKPTAPNVVILSADDVYHPLLEQIVWSNIAQVLVCGSSAQIDILMDRVPDIYKKSQLLKVDAPVHIQDWPFTSRGQGKRLAAVGPFGANHNPSYLLQCMQKLNYLDRDYRLYLAGGFEDRAAEQHCRYMINRLNLDGVVVIENTVGSLSNWLRDKHYIVQTSTTAGHIHTVWAAMACGLKPVIGAFAGSDDLMDGRYVFGIAEEFCAQVRDADYQPHTYRHWIEQRVASQGFFKTLYLSLSKIERQLALGAAPKQQTAAPIAAPRQPQSVPVPAAPSLTPIRNSMPQAVSPAPQPVLQSAPPKPKQTPAPVPSLPQTAAPAAAKSIGQIAEEALKASHRLRDMISSARQDAQSEEPIASPFVR